MVTAVPLAVSEGADPGGTAAELVRLMGVSTPYGNSMFGGMSLQNVQGITRYLARHEGGA
jgi:hypothetical protein